MADIGAYAESVYQQVLPLHGPDPDGLAHQYVGAVCQPMREIDELVRDTPEGTGWSIILDADDAPVKGLYWLSQLAGVRLRQPKTVFDVNAATYPDFEPVTVRWTPSTDADVDRVAGHDHGHAWQGRLTATASSSDVYAQYQQSIAVVQGKSYTISLDVTAQDTDTILIAQWFSGVDFIDTTTGPNEVAATRHVVDLVAPPGADTLIVLLYLGGSATTGDTADFDALSVRRTDEPVPGEYVAGDLPGGSWDGTAHESTSRVGRLETDNEWGAYARDAIKRQGGKNRGTPDAILSVAEDTLIGTRTARLLERVGGNAYALELITRPSETPDPAATLRAMIGDPPLYNGAIPGGMSLTHTMTEDLLIDEDTGDIDSATGTIDVPT